MLVFYWFHPVYYLEKNKISAYNNTDSSVRKLASVKTGIDEKYVFNWLKKICVTNAKSAHDAVEVIGQNALAEGPIETFKAIEESTRDNVVSVLSVSYSRNRGGYFVHTRNRKTGNHRMVTIKACIEGSDQKIAKWLEEAKVCFLSDAKNLLRVFKWTEVIKGWGDLNFYYLETSSKTFKVGRRKCRGTLEYPSSKSPITLIKCQKW